MNRYLYETSVSYRGHLIIPFCQDEMYGQPIYSYALLSAWGHKGAFHKVANPSGLVSTSTDGIVAIAREFLDDQVGDPPSQLDAASRHFHRVEQDYFQHRYTYRDHLIVIFKAHRKYFYDHYRPDSLDNIAAPKIFQSERACLNWIQSQLKTAYSSRQAG